MMLFERDRTKLHYQEFGGSGPPWLLLHGLAGYAGEWRRSACLLVADFRVLALDQRGHGDSERRPGDVSRDAYVEDPAETIRRIGRGPVTLVGQSMGGNTAMLVAARYPELVTTLVGIEASPDGPDPPNPEPPIAQQIRESLSLWPVPFADVKAAERFFEGKGFDPVAWAQGLEQRAQGLWPRFEVEVLARCMADLGSAAIGRSGWTSSVPRCSSWGSLGCFPQPRARRSRVGSGDRSSP